MKVEQILSAKGADVFSVTTTDPISKAVDVLGKKNIGAVLVKDKAGAVAGILSERDVVRMMRTGGAATLSEPVSSCMTANPHTCGLETSVDELMMEMTEKRIRHMPVVKDGALVGVVSIGDVVKRKIENAEQEAAALKEYISS